MAIERQLPTGYYVYTISVADVVRYIGKGKGFRLYSPHERGQEPPYSLL
jgi:hypothetical protein